MPTLVSHQQEQRWRVANHGVAVNMELKGRSRGLKMDLMAESDHQQVICYSRKNRVPKCLVARRSTQRIEGLEREVEEVREIRFFERMGVRLGIDMQA